MGECGLNFSTSHTLKVTKPKNAAKDGRFAYGLTCKEHPDEERLPEGFWGERIYNLTALVGENGTSKSTLLISVIRAVVKGLDLGAPFFLVLQKTDSQELLFYQSTNLNLTVEKPIPSFSMVNHSNSGNYLDEEDQGKRPLAKLTQDLLHDLGVPIE